MTQTTTRLEKTIRVHTPEEAALILGRNDEIARAVETELGVSVVYRGERLIIQGKEQPVHIAEKFFHELREIIRLGGQLRPHDVGNALRSVADKDHVPLYTIFLDRIEIMSKRQWVTPKTRGQKAYVDAMKTHDIVFGIGPAGTGKTYLAMAMAVAALKQQQVNRVILTRPAVEAGENLGFLPGDLQEKITPYLRPMYDALYDMIDSDTIGRLMNKGVIEIAPLAYMRGRTLNDSFVILDEAQNSTAEQMKMFLTRLGFDSRAVITGDITQVDLPVHKSSGLIQVQSILKGIAGIRFMYLDEQDIVRHNLVQQIIKAYAVFEEKKEKRSVNAQKAV
ncbi:MAG: PhoH family protein [Candidatus Omnitrophica bacterium]|nr:PhoH family protein [Candidatus Omnitrophota bacterium]